MFIDVLCAAVGLWMICALVFGFNDTKGMTGSDRAINILFSSTAWFFVGIYVLSPGWRRRAPVQQPYEKADVSDVAVSQDDGILVEFPGADGA